MTGRRRRQARAQGSGCRARAPVRRPRGHTERVRSSTRAKRRPIGRWRCRGRNDHCAPSPSWPAARCRLMAPSRSSRTSPPHSRPSQARSSTATSSPRTCSSSRAPCSLADFGIARYAEATTASNTWKDAWSAPYAAPERWQHQRATGATDVYSLGVMAHEILSGAWPFAGPDRADFRDQHLGDDPPALTRRPGRLASLVTECLFKDPGARPTAANVLARLGRVSATPSRGAAALQAANAAAQSARAEEQAHASAAAQAADRHGTLLRAAETSFHVVSEALREAVSENAPAAVIDPGRQPDDWSFKLGSATLGIQPPVQTPSAPWGAWTPPVRGHCPCGHRGQLSARHMGLRRSTPLALVLRCSRRASFAGTKPHSWSVPRSPGGSCTTEPP